MPALSDAEISALIEAGRIGALALDTNVFEPGRNLRSPIVRRLAQFAIRPERVLFSDVVANELIRHIAESAEETQRALKKHLRAHNLRWYRTAPHDEHKTLMLDQNPRSFAEAEFERFCEALGADLLDAAVVPDITRLVLDRYFQDLPPFGHTEERKREFPDAYALITLENFASEKDTCILCISADKGWIEFSEQSDRLVCVGKTSDAIALFHDHIKASEVVQKWRDGGIGDHLERVSTAFASYLDGIPFDVEATADLYFEAEPYDAVLEFVDPTSLGDPQALSVDEDTVTFSVTVDARVKFTALFTFYVHDSVDREYVAVNTDEYETVSETTFQLVVTALKESGETPEFVDVEIESARLTADFGHLDVVPDQDPAAY